MMMVVGGLVAAVPALGASDEPGALVCNGKPQKGARAGLLCDGKNRSAARAGLVCNAKPQNGARAGLLCNGKPQNTTALHGKNAGFFCNMAPKTGALVPAVHQAAPPAKTTTQ